MIDEERAWLSRAVKHIEADFCRSADTHLLAVPLPHCPGITLYLKDESTHPTGSLKHRLARSLFLYALCNGWIGSETPVIESSSGSTAVSEAYFAQLLGLRFIAVVPRATAQAKLDAIEFYGGECRFVETSAQASSAAMALAKDLSGHFMDQFTFAERATDWRGNNNIAESLFEQMACEPHPVPSWIVCGAGTGGTSATLGRFIRYNCYGTRICIADPEHSVFHRHWRDRTIDSVNGDCSLIEGIGRPQVEPSFIPAIVDRAISVGDDSSVASARAISQVLGKLCGGSTGTNVWASMQIAQEMHAAGESGSIVSILCDSGDRYRATYFDDNWVAREGLELEAPKRTLEAFFNLDTAAGGHS